MKPKLTLKVEQQSSTRAKPGTRGSTQKTWRKGMPQSTLNTNRNTRAQLLPFKNQYQAEVLGGKDGAASHKQGPPVKSVNGQGHRSRPSHRPVFTCWLHLWRSSGALPHSQWGGERWASVHGVTHSPARLCQLLPVRQPLASPARYSTPRGSASFVFTRVFRWCARGVRVVWSCLLVFMPSCACCVWWKATRHPVN